MRSFEKLSTKGKLHRVYFSIINFFIYTVWKHGIEEFLYWFRTHTYNRYHIIDLRTKDIYKWGWIDQDNRMFIACFKCLEDFVEKEKPFEQTDYEWSDEARQEKKEIQELYNWWKVELPALYKQDYTTGKWQDLEVIEEQMLMRLMKMRKRLWT